MLGHSARPQLLTLSARYGAELLTALSPPPCLKHLHLYRPTLSTTLMAVLCAMPNLRTLRLTNPWIDPPPDTEAVPGPAQLAHDQQLPVGQDIGDEGADVGTAEENPYTSGEDTDNVDVPYVTAWEHALLEEN